MRAAYYNKSGPAHEVIQIGEFDDPQPGLDDILIRVKTSGVNPSDIKSRTTSFARVKDQLPLIPHTDGAGIIEEVGSNVHSLEPGDRVWIGFAQWRGSNGTCAEYVSVPKNFVFPLPANTEFEVGACAGVPILTAMHALYIGPNVNGKSVLITGGATSVGNYAIQFAKKAGARVLTTVGDESKAKTASSAGADETILYKQSNLAEQISQLTDGHGVDYLVDMDMSYYAPLYPSIVAQNGFVVVYGSNHRSADGVPTHAFFMRGLTLKGFLLWNLPEEHVRRLGEKISDLFADNALKHNIGAIYPFLESAEAQDVVEHGKVSGNVVIQIE